MSTPEEPEQTTEDPEEFSPTGTLFLLSLYFLLLVGLWIFMYFVEFIGRGPTIIGG